MTLLRSKCCKAKKKIQWRGFECMVVCSKCKKDLKKYGELIPFEKRNEKAMHEMRREKTII